jgi:hypothetical protein
MATYQMIVQRVTMVRFLYFPTPLVCLTTSQDTDLMATYQVIVQGGNQLDDTNPPLAIEDTERTLSSEYDLVDAEGINIDLFPIASTVEALDCSVKLLQGQVILRTIHSEQATIVSLQEVQNKVAVDFAGNPLRCQVMIQMIRSDQAPILSFSSLDRYELETKHDMEEKSSTTKAGNAIAACEGSGTIRGPAVD